MLYKNVAKLFFINTVISREIQMKGKKIIQNIIQEIIR